MIETKTPHFLRMSYQFGLPCFKQGDDLGRELRNHPNDVASAFEAQARAYEECARLCRVMAKVATEIPDLKVSADTHVITVTGPYDKLEPLVSDGLLSAWPGDDEEDRAITAAALEDQLLDAMDGKGPFTVVAAMETVAEVDSELSGLNPVWVKAVLDGLVAEGVLSAEADRYRVRPV